MVIIALVYLLTILIPINGALYLGMYHERKRIRRLLLQYWKLANSRRNW